MMMKFFSISFYLGTLAVLVVGPVSAFSPPTRQQQQQQQQQQRQPSHLFSTLDGTQSPSLDKSAITSGPKQRVLDIAYDLKDQFGVFVIDKKGKEDLLQAVENLEAVAEKPAFDDDVKDIMVGDWTLVCTTSSSSGSLPSPISGGIDTSKLPFFNQGPLRDIRQSLNKCLLIQQSIMTKNSDQIDRVDHILEYRPPKTLQDLIDNLPSLNINPLDVTRGKVVLVHEADVTNKGPGFSIQLKLASIVCKLLCTNTFLVSLSFFMRIHF